MTGLGLRRLPDGLARWPFSGLRGDHSRGYSKSFELRGVDTERGGVCHALYLAVTLLSAPSTHGMCDSSPARRFGRHEKEPSTTGPAGSSQKGEPAG